MSVLLTGGSGFIGLNIAEALLDEGADIVLYGTQPPRPEAVAAFGRKSRRFHFVQGNVLDKQQLDSTWKAFEIDSVIHGAAITPDESREIGDGAGVIQVNCIGTLNVLETANRHQAVKFIYLSSIAAYGRTAATANELYEEGIAHEPETLYEITKYAAEKIALRFKRLTGLNVTAARLGDIFGPWEHETGVRDVMSAPFQTMRKALLRQQAFLPGTGRKCWIYSRDVAAAVVAIWKAASLRHDIYNVSSDYQWSVPDWCALLKKRYPDFVYGLARSPLEANIKLFADNAPMNVDRLRNDTGFQAEFSLERAFNDYSDWAERHSGFICG